MSHIHIKQKWKVKWPVVEIIFDKVVGHLFSDSMSLVIQEAPPWLALSGEILQIWPTRLLEIALSDFFKDFF